MGPEDKDIPIRMKAEIAGIKLFAFFLAENAQRRHGSREGDGHGRCFVRILRDGAVRVPVLCILLIRAERRPVPPCESHLQNSCARSPLR